jgi:hypothetical protein
MLADGVYELFYRCDGTDDPFDDSLLVALRGGRLLGSDRWGGVFIGRCDFDPATQRNRITGRLQVPPGGMLVTDVAPRPDGRVIPVAADLQLSGQHEASTVVDVDGGRVRIDLVFKGPVPR